MLLKKAGFEDREVCFISGHSNPKSLSSYSQPDEVKAKMAFALDTKPVSESSTSLVVSSTENANEQETSDSVASPKIQFSPAADAPVGIVFNAPNSSLQNVIIHLGHRSKRSKLSLKRKQQD